RKRAFHSRKKAERAFCIGFTRNTGTHRMSKGKILIADDEAAIRSLLKIVVERAGFEAEFARDGAEAIAKLSEGDHLVLLLDLMMPNVNGYEVAQHLKTMSRRPA